VESCFAAESLKLSRRVILPGSVMLSAAIMLLAAIIFVGDHHVIERCHVRESKGSFGQPWKWKYFEQSVCDGKNGWLKERQWDTLCSKVNHNKLWYTASQADLAVWFFTTGSALFVVDDSGYRVPRHYGLAQVW
jgi:hypothetical protein